MGAFDNWDAMIDEIERKNDLWEQRVTQVAYDHFASFANDLYERFGQYQQAKITSIFRGAVQRFYDAYTPQQYHRTYSLFNLLQPQLDERGFVAYDDALDLIDRDEVHVDRQGGDSLFDTVFMEGWHGGSKHIAPGKEEIWGKHPNPGVAYYRKPGMVKYPGASQPRRHRYGKWGKRAVRTTAPYTLFNQGLDDADGEMHQVFRDMAESGWKDECVSIQSDVNEISREIYG